MLKSFWRMTDRPSGFGPDHILAMRLISLRTPRVRRSRLCGQADRATESGTGVEGVSINTHGDRLTHIEVEGAPIPAANTPIPPIYMNQTSADFASVMDSA